MMMSIMNHLLAPAVDMLSGRSCRVTNTKTRDATGKMVSISGMLGILYSVFVVDFRNGVDEF